MADLPPDLAAFAPLFDAQPAPVRDAFNYCLCLLPFKMATNATAQAA